VLSPVYIKETTDVYSHTIIIKKFIFFHTLFLNNCGSGENGAIIKLIALLRKINDSMKYEIRALKLG